MLTYDFCCVRILVTPKRTVFFLGELLWQIQLDQKLWWLAQNVKKEIMPQLKTKRQIQIELNSTSFVLVAENTLFTKKQNN